jgi:hypothetical protein
MRCGRLNNRSRARAPNALDSKGTANPNHQGTLILSARTADRLTAGTHFFEKTRKTGQNDRRMSETSGE